MSLHEAAPCSRLAGDPEPGVRVSFVGAKIARLTPAEARLLGADLILCANASEAQWDAPGPRARETEDSHEH